MKKTVIATLIVGTSLALAACGGSTTTTTENTLTTNEVVVDDGLGTDNFTAVDTLNETGSVLDNGADATLNAADATGNAVVNATE